MMNALLSGVAFSAQASDSLQKERIHQARIERQQINALLNILTNQVAHKPVPIATLAQLVPYLQETARNQNKF